MTNQDLNKELGLSADWMQVNDETAELKLCTKLTGYVEVAGTEHVGYILSRSGGRYAYQAGFDNADVAREWVEDKIVTSRQYRDAINKVAL